MRARLEPVTIISSTSTKTMRVALFEEKMKREGS
jgi:hypothetical protein